MQWCLTGHLHGVAASLPEPLAGRVTHHVVGRQAGFAGFGRPILGAVLPHRHHDVDDENDGQDEEDDAEHRAYDDRHPRWPCCRSGCNNNLLTVKYFVNYNISISHYVSYFVNNTKYTMPNIIY